MSSRNSLSLFNQSDLRTDLESHERELLERIELLDQDRLLNTNPEELADYFASEFAVEIPTLRNNETETSQEAVKIDVSHDPLRVMFDHSGPVYVDGTRFTFHVPFTGDRNLFNCRASQYSINPPRGKIVGNELQVIYEQTDLKAEALKDQFSRDLMVIQNHLDWITSDVNPFNSRLRERALAKIKQRRDKLIKDQNVVAELGFPVRRREGAANTYVVPTKRKKLPMPASSSIGGIPPEPILDLETYEFILNIIQNMALVIERSPKAFLEMDEEAFRQHFLVQLNGQFEGQATGETFNYEGKTDILIRSDGKNIFIAECKFWDGQKSLNDAIHQVLGYATWRDTKVAILLFNRTKNFSKVVAQIPEVINSHDSYVRELPYASESGFRAVLRHKNDPERELTLTVLAFDTPQPVTK